MSPIIVFFDECQDPSYPVPVRVDSPFWFEWLAKHRSFRFECTHGNISVIKDREGYWTASKKVDGKLRRKRLGISQKVTLRQLSEACKLLCVSGLWKDHQKENKERHQQENINYKEAYEQVNQRATMLEQQELEARELVKKLAGRVAALEEELDKVSQQKCDTSKDKSLQTIIKRYRARAKNTRDWTQAKRLIQEIEKLITDPEQN